MGLSSVSPRPLPPHLRPPHLRGVQGMFMFMYGSFSACWCSFWRCSSFPYTGSRTSSPLLPLSPTAAAREEAPSPTWRYVASHLRGPPSLHSPPEGCGREHIQYRHMHMCSHWCMPMQTKASMHTHIKHTEVQHLLTVTYKHKNLLSAPKKLT